VDEAASRRAAATLSECLPRLHHGGRDPNAAPPEEGQEMNRRNESGRIGYLVLYLMGVPIGVLILLWVLLGNNIFGPG
jgi:hypothetical protein